MYFYFRFLFMYNLMQSYGFIIINLIYFKNIARGSYSIILKIYFLSYTHLASNICSITKANTMIVHIIKEFFICHFKINRRAITNTSPTITSSLNKYRSNNVNNRIYFITIRILFFWKHNN